MDVNNGKELVKTFGKSGLSQREFCNKHNIKRSTLRYWQDRIKDYKLGKEVCFCEIVVEGES